MAASSPGSTTSSIHATSGSDSSTDCDFTQTSDSTLTTQKWDHETELRGQMRRMERSTEIVFTPNDSTSGAQKLDAEAKLREEIERRERAVGRLLKGNDVWNQQ